MSQLVTIREIRSDFDGKRVLLGDYRISSGTQEWETAGPEELKVCALYLWSDVAAFCKALALYPVPLVEEGTTLHSSALMYPYTQ